jgi:hypothetical protein
MDHLPGLEINASEGFYLGLPRRATVQEREAIHLVGILPIRGCRV